LSMLLQDLRYSSRRLVRAPGFTLTAILTLALGIGANTAIFSTVNALLLRPYPFPKLDRLMLLREADPNHPGEDRSAPADYLDIRAQARAFSDIAAFRFGDFNLGNESGTGAIEGYRVTTNLFQMIGARPLLGRDLSSNDGEEGRNLVAVISHNTWRERFASDPSVVGKTVRLNGRNTNIVGVMPAGFHYPLGAEIWMPLTLTSADRAERLSRNLSLLATLKEGVSRKQAEAELQAFSNQLQRQYPTTNASRSTTLLPLREEQYAYTAPMFLILQAAAGFVLLLACANFLNLLLAQAVSRRHEIAVRSALGADRLQLARLFTGETMLLALLAVSLAVGVSSVSVTVIRNGMPSGMTKWIAGWNDIHLDAHVLSFAAVLGLVLALVFGIAGTFHASRMDVSAALKENSRSSSGSRAQHRVLSGLVITQVIFAVVLLTGAASAIRSVFALSQLYRGFDPDNLLTLEVGLPKPSYTDAARIASFYERALRQTQSLPQVDSAALAANLPASNVDSEVATFEIPGRNSLRVSEEPSADLQVVSPDFFSTLRINLLKGRTFSESDGRNSPRVTVVSESLAVRSWPNSIPIGQSLKLSADNGNPVTVVGVVSDVKLNWYDPKPHPTIYLPYLQAPRASLTLLARIKPGGGSAAPEIRRQLQQLDPEIALNEIQPLTSEISDSLAPIRIIGWLMLVFGAVALGLSTVGIYGMLSHRVARRTHEFGVRIALGATSDDLFRQILGEALTLAGIGLALGLPLAYGLNLVAANQLFGLNGLSWPILAIFTLGVLLVALLAALVPAHRAMRSDPVLALRYE
jgi:putative ABC transport system permease protein